MINLLKFLPDGGREAYKRYAESATKAAQQALSRAFFMASYPSELTTIRESGAGKI